MKRIFQLSILSISTLFLASCERETVVDDPAPTVDFNIMEPVNMSTFHLGDTIHIHGNITYAPGLHGYKLEIYNTSADTTVLSKEEHAHGSSIDLHEMWVNDVTQHSDMQLIVTAEISHDGMSVTDTVHFHCHPM